MLVDKDRVDKDPHLPVLGGGKVFPSHLTAVSAGGQHLDDLSSLLTAAISSD